MLRTSTRADSPDHSAALLACEFGPLATRRKRVAFACRCLACAQGVGTDGRLVKLLQVGRAYGGRTATVADVQAALRDADRAAAEISDHAREDVWSIFEGRRAGDAMTFARAARATTAGIRWALGAGGAPAPIPANWVWAKKSLSDSTTAPVRENAWLTPDVVALARHVQNGGTDALPILADALQDAGCGDERVLGHCRADCPHGGLCWVPDLLLDGE